MQTAKFISLLSMLDQLTGLNLLYDTEFSIIEFCNFAKSHFWRARLGTARHAPHVDREAASRRSVDIGIVDIETKRKHFYAFQAELCTHPLSS